MLNKNEFFSIAGIMLLLALTFSLLKTWDFFLHILIAVFFVIALNILAKKIMANYLESEIEVEIWKKKYWLTKKFKRWFGKRFPLGIILPIVFSIVSLGFLNWMACLVFDVKPRAYRTSKKHGLYSFSEMTENHLGLIAASGIIINLLLGIVGYLVGFQEFAKINLYYAFFNILPISDLDGNKIFFGNIVLWSFLASLVLIGILCLIFIV